MLPEIYDLAIGGVNLRGGRSGDIVCQALEERERRAMPDWCVDGGPFKVCSQLAV